MRACGGSGKPVFADNPASAAEYPASAYNTYTFGGGNDNYRFQRNVSERTLQNGAYILLRKFYLRGDRIRNFHTFGRAEHGMAQFGAVCKYFPADADSFHNNIICGDLIFQIFY